MATLINKRGSLKTDPIRNFRFLVTFLQGGDTGAGWKPQSTVGFTSVSGLSVTTESIPYREGGYNTTVHQIPGQTTFSPVTFQRGVVLGTRQHWDWMRMLFSTVQGGTQRYGKDQPFRADIEISVLAHPVPYASTKSGYGQPGVEESNTDNGVVSDDIVPIRFRLYNAWPTSVAYSDLNAGDNALMVEQLTVVHEGLDMRWATNTNTSAPEFGAGGDPGVGGGPDPD